MHHAHKQRFSVEGEAQKNKAIKVSEEWMTELKSMPFTSQKNGRTLHLLKTSAKSQQPHKKRKTLPIMGTLSEFKTANQYLKEEESQRQQEQSEVLGNQNQIPSDFSEDGLE